MDAVLDHILSLTRTHLQVTTDEKWEIWPGIAEKKKALVAQLGRSPESPPGADSQVILDEIRMLETRTLDTLREKRQSVVEELGRIKHRKKAVSGYGQVAQSRVQGHFGISC